VTGAPFSKESTMTDIGRRRFVQGALGTTAFLALPGRLVARPQAAAAAGSLPDRYPPIFARFPHLLHGGDWNPDQWRDEPGILEQDFALMEKAGCNTFSVGIFAWAALEPEEGRFEMGWLDERLWFRSFSVMPQLTCQLRDGNQVAPSSRLVTRFRVSTKIGDPPTLKTRSSFC